MDNWQKNRISAAINGTNPMVMAELEGGYAAFGDTQFLPGYCVLLPKRNVASLNELSIVERTMSGYEHIRRCHFRRLSCRSN